MTVEEINALPDRVRSFVHDLSTRCDPAGELAELTLTRDQNRQLQALVEELKAWNNRIGIAMGEAAAEIYCSGPVAHRIRVLKGHHDAQIWRLINERDRAVEAREEAIARADQAEAKVEWLQTEYAKRNDLPVYLDQIDLQELARIRLNPFAVNLVVESYNGHGNWKGLRPYRIRFILADVEIYVGPADRTTASAADAD